MAIITGQRAGRLIHREGLTVDRGGLQIQPKKFKTTIWRTLLSERKSDTTPPKGGGIDPVVAGPPPTGGSGGENFAILAKF